MTKKEIITNEVDICELERKIDEGIHLAQERLIARARHNNTTLVIAHHGKVLEVTADELRTLA